MKFTIVTACHNAESYLEDTIKSILQQQGEFGIEYIILDNCSTDRTGEIIGRYKKRYDDGHLEFGCRSLELHCVHERDDGLYDALTKGFSMATGDIVAYLNASDFYFAGAFATVNQIFSENPDVRWLTGTPVSASETGQPIYWILPLRYNLSMVREGYYGKRLYYIQQESTFWRRELLNTVDMASFRQLRQAGDFYLWFSFAGVAQLYQVRSFLAASRQHANRLSDDRKAYGAEVRTFTSRQQVKNHFHAVLQWGLTYLLPDKIKTILNGRIFVYKKGKWLKRLR